MFKIHQPKPFQVAPIKYKNNRKTSFCYQYQPPKGDRHRWLSSVVIYWSSIETAKKLSNDILRYALFVFFK